MASPHVAGAIALYLKARGIPRSPRDLVRHDGIAFAPTSVGDPWAFKVGARRLVATPRTLLKVNDTEVAIAAALAGRGLTRVLSYQVADDVRKGRLKIVLEKVEPPPIPIHLVHLEGRRANARIRAFVDFAAKSLRAALV